MDKENEYPFTDDKDSSKEVTVEMMIEMLKTIPPHYKVRYDSACGLVHKGDFTIFHYCELVSING